MTDEKTTPEDVQQTLQAYLTRATETGAFRGAHVQFAADLSESQVSFETVWKDALPSGVRPIAARATVHRDGWVIPTIVTELWDEVVPADEAWRDLWEARPHVLFGAHALRTALRRTFADVLGDRREPDDDPAGGPTPTAVQLADEYEAAVAAKADPVDYAGLVAAASTLNELAAARHVAREARAMTLELKAAINARRAELEGVSADASDPAPVKAEEPRKDAPRPSAPTVRAPKPRNRRKRAQGEAPQTSMAAAVLEALDKQKAKP